MEKIHEMVAAMCDAAASYADEHKLDNNEVMNALAQTYVVCGFAFQKKGIHLQVMKDALVGCVSESCDHMIEVSANAEEA